MSPIPIRESRIRSGPDITWTGRTANPKHSKASRDFAMRFDRCWSLGFDRNFP